MNQESTTDLPTKEKENIISCKYLNDIIFDPLSLQHYFRKSDPEADSKVNAIFKVLCSQENDTVRAKTFTHFGRNITFEKTCGQVLNTTFDELCDRALGASDYLQLAQYFHTIIIRDVPQLNLKLKSQTRRFITLIDSLYDHRIRVSSARLIHFLKLTDKAVS